MKFSDIPRLTKSAPYCVTQPWSSLVERVDNYCKEDGFDVDPDFQRGYVWSEAQKTRYVEFMLRGGTSASNIYTNHPGWMKDWKGPYQLVDGKQRLQAALGFMRGKVRAFGLFNHQYEDVLRFSGPHFNWHVNDLQTRAEVLQWYLEMNSGGTVHTQEELEKVRALIAKEHQK